MKKVSKGRTIELVNLAGVFTPVPTPFDADDRLDTARLRAAFVGWVASPLTGFVVLGSNGEAVLLDEVETDRVLVSARDAIPSGRPFIAGTGRESTQASVRAAKRAAEIGADAVLVRTPGFYKPQMDADAFIRHYTAVADASPVPVILYNFTMLTGVTLPVAAVTRLAGHPNIVGMKESGGDVARIAELVSATPGDFPVLAGSAAAFYPALCVGARGGILALASVVPNACVRLFELTREGRHDEARALQRQLMPLARLLGSQYGVPGLKAALKLVGCDVGHPRRPLLPLAEPAIATLGDALQAFQEIPA